MSAEPLNTIHGLRAELEVKLQALFEEFQRRAECRGVQIMAVEIHQVDWHNGYDETAPNNTNENLKSGPHWGYRIQRVGLHLVLK